MPAGTRHKSQIPHRTNLRHETVRSSCGILRIPATLRGKMIIINDEYVTLDTPTGPMRTHIVRPAAPGRYPGVIFYSEIFQITAPIRRTAAMLAGHGYVVAMPEIYPEFVEPGEVFAYDQAGSDRGNALKTTK